jgi:CelD/BcsL family acetyltransferase involved in cellulose biosynthesis
MKAYPSVWDKTAVGDLSQGWEKYRDSRKGVWRRRLHQAEAKLERQGTVEYLRYRPEPGNAGLEENRFDFFAECMALAEKSWQATASDGTTLCHPSVRPFLQELHAAAVAEGAVDINLLLLDGRPAAFIYGYHYKGYVFGLRRGFDADLSRTGVGNVLLWHTLRDGTERGDSIYDMGPGSLESKRHFLTHLTPIYRHSHFPNGNLRTQILRMSRWWKSRQLAAK